MIQWKEKIKLTESNMFSLKWERNLLADCSRESFLICSWILLLFLWFSFPVSSFQTGNSYVVCILACKNSPSSCTRALKTLASPSSSRLAGSWVGKRLFQDPFHHKRTLCRWMWLFCGGDLYFFECPQRHPELLQFVFHSMISWGSINICLTRAYWTLAVCWAVGQRWGR